MAPEASLQDHHRCHGPAPPFNSRPAPFWTGSPLLRRPSAESTMIQPVPVRPRPCKFLVAPPIVKFPAVALLPDENRMRCPLARPALALTWHRWTTVPRPSSAFFWPLLAAQFGAPTDLLLPQAVGPA
ncbi:hypothetical protein TRIUR3_23938 [Triticum urartu]|uniref:Uncharacterized protein n=1 Tax=Triticum urartu TaxID=4572 RepID=M8ARG6_TRIUA|nr:hypothetical protein TRIUR3_23938 [Triticum urartu]